MELLLPPQLVLLLLLVFTLQFRDFTLLLLGCLGPFSNPTEDEEDEQAEVGDLFIWVSGSLCHPPLFWANKKKRTRMCLCASRGTRQNAFECVTNSLSLSLSASFGRFYDMFFVFVVVIAVFLVT